MLARTFLTPQQLNITPSLHEALIVVLDKMERGEIRHSSEGYRLGGEGNWFNMRDIRVHAECGTVMCIAGWADEVRGMGLVHPLGPTAAYNERMFNSPLTRLFVPPNFFFRSSFITVEQTRKALYNYLTKGEPDWPGVLGPF